MVGTELRPIGYGAIADGMGADNTLLIFRRFGCLNARNLLYMQAELSHLESRLLTLDNSLDSMSQGLARWEVPRSWERLIGSEEGIEELKLVTEIRQKLEQYNNALHIQASIATLNKPDQRVWRVLTDFVDDNRNALIDKDKAMFHQDVYPDLVTLARRTSDPMTTFLINFFAELFQSKADRCLTRGNLNFTSDGRIRGFVRILAVVISSLLPIASIVVLYFIQSQPARLYTIVAFSSLCSIALAVLTDARNVEIIAATAAYAAIQVVFVSGTVSP